VAGRGRSLRLLGRSLGVCPRGEAYKRKQRHVLAHPIPEIRTKRHRHSIILSEMGVRALGGLAFNLGAYRAFKRGTKQKQKTLPVVRRVGLTQSKLFYL